MPRRGRRRRWRIFRALRTPEDPNVRVLPGNRPNTLTFYHAPPGLPWVLLERNVPV
jgi:hypothetical protein